MAEDISASVITLHQPRPKQAKTPAERARAYRERKKASGPNGPPPSSEHLIPLDFPSADGPNGTLPVPAPANALAEMRQTAKRNPGKPRAAAVVVAQMRQLRIAPSPAVTLRAVTPSRRPVASIVLMIAALALAIVGVTINGWFARSLGSSEVAGWLFLAIGVAADVTALAVPSCAAGLWQARQWGTAAAAWAVWAMTFAFAVTAGIGFASVNIADVTMNRASRATPAVTTAQAALGDAMTSRDLECKGGVGFCREREAQVADRRQALDTAMRTVEQTADPQTEAAIRSLPG